ncbi:unnamed protein product [Darwinula stevensoni]|uniref:Rab-GAP TBC domain-containing protein n=1 Tax=Darwinula stevensoni TaxID=69355 RepID=A0A7R8WYB6_9CRUS|nr:unnamed protein product [Darwinula stevensoni]CAG0879175.1 unnamed protein product [Darwinula stevensoni]
MANGCESGRSKQILFQHLKDKKIVDEVFSQMKLLAASEDVEESSLWETLREAMISSGLSRFIQNQVNYSIERHPWLVFPSHALGSSSLSEPLLHLNKAQAGWQRRLHKSLQSMCAELNTTLLRPRRPENKTAFQQKWNALSTLDLDLTVYRPVYSPRDFLEVLITLKNPNRHEDTLSSIPSDYVKHVGLVLDRDDAMLTKEFAKLGCPHGLRTRLWSHILGVPGPQDAEHMETLKSSVFSHELLLDYIVIKDTQLTACNDDQYFVYEDTLYQVLLCFLRDKTIPQYLTHVSVFQGKKDESQSFIYPLSGVIPFYGFSMYVAPICYLYEEPEKVYGFFREFYIRYWKRLHVIDSSPEGILSLTALFEHLLLVSDPHLFSHLHSKHIEPCSMVFKWLMRGFAGSLRPEQVLFLWDLILAYDSLLIVPVLAAAILSLRRENLLAVSTLQAAEAVLADLSSIKVIPLLRLVFSKCCTS